MTKDHAHETTEVLETRPSGTIRARCECGAIFLLSPLGAAALTEAKPRAYCRRARCIDEAMGPALVTHHAGECLGGSPR